MFADLTLEIPTNFDSEQLSEFLEEMQGHIFGEQNLMKEAI